MKTIDVVLTDWIEDFKKIESNSYVENEIVFKDDPLALACSLKNLVETNNGHYSLDDLRVSDNITPEIRAHAEVVRKYYSKKFFWNNLSGLNNSSFRSRVCSLLEGHVRTCTEKDRGIYYKLPWFYDEDMIYDEFKKTYNTTNLSSLGSKRNNVFTKRLTYLKSSKGWQKNRKSEYFWFTDDNKDLYCIPINLDNTLLSMFRGMIEENPTPLFETMITEDRLDNMHFYKLFNFKFIKESHA
jgi:hypothetical protein